MLIRKINFLAMICLFLQFNVVDAQASAEEDAQALVNIMITEATFAAIYETRRETLMSEFKKKMDFAGVSDHDLNEYVNLLTGLMIKGMVAGMRVEFKNKFLADMPADDLSKFLACTLGNNCHQEEFSKTAINTLQGLRDFGREKGQAIGQAIGGVIAPDMLRMIKENEDGVFENPDSLLDAMKRMELRQG